MAKLSEFKDFGYTDFISINALSKRVGMSRLTLKKLLIDKDIQLHKRNSILRCSPYMISIKELREKLSNQEFEDQYESKYEKLAERVLRLEAQVRSLSKHIVALSEVTRAAVNNVTKGEE